MLKENWIWVDTQNSLILILRRLRNCKLYANVENTTVFTKFFDDI